MIDFKQRIAKAVAEVVNIDEKELDALETSIIKFIVELFRSPDEMDIKKITETKDFFIVCFSKIKSVEAELKTTLRIK